MNELQRALSSVTYRLHANALLRSLLLGGAAYLLVAAFGGPWGWPVGAGVAGLAVGAWVTKLFESKKPLAVQYIHQTVGDAEYSLPLLDKSDLNIAEQLQLERLAGRIHAGQIRDSRVPGVLWQQIGPYALALGIGLLAFLGLPYLKTTPTNNPMKQMLFVEKQLPEKPDEPPAFRSATLQIQPPAYTRLPQRNTRDLNATALVGSVLTWQVRFSRVENLSVKLVNSRGQEIPFRKTGDGFSYKDQLLNSGLYAIKAYWQMSSKRDSLVYQSDFYRLEATPDLAPKIEPGSKELYTFHYLRDPKTLTIAAKISDDFSVSQAFIVATVARGSGENVKFREVRMPVGRANFREARLSKTIDLNALNFAPGDELYYYWAAFDNRQPEPNFTKSDTYFVVYKDTTILDETELATMAVNIMPEYFRSQRQIIIDTEKLIAGRKRIPEKAFKSSSNEIGFDQKALRLRYGQFLGEEFEKSIGGGDALPTDRDGDVVVGFAAMQQYMHKHDEGEGDHSTPTGSHAGHDHGHSHGGGPSADDKDPVAALMEQYVHSHDDAETNTFHEQSTRSLLKMALENMWQSELHLRLYEPEKALPFERKALEYLKLSQQKARSYVRKTGFDPPPIKEKEIRLTGELINVDPTTKQTRSFTQQRIESMASAVLGFVDLPQLTAGQRQTVQQLGNALANPVLNSGLPNWSVLASLQKLVGGKALSVPEKTSLKTKLYTLAGSSERSRSGYDSNRKLEQAFWRNL
ncbi:hypothetical protein [Spirosoma montaniterrae]|uniref:DUF4175 domain-containing protein n=1 Tax=Spirosoma montaniterrae TaxID=1178516 RepID=A0A1P9WWP6_9BACT|nr:hypothetical protein [Spirosoma montaniterrae]AQG79796.1 hypothetical protein AWR27_10945 [Spirosoma montaniterrae]